MLKRLLNNTLISAVAFGIVGVVGLMLVPVLVRGYGLALYGLLALARALVPNGLLALADPGFSEQAIRVIAQAGVDGNWSRAGRRLSVLLLMALGIGVTIGSVLAVAAPWWAVLFRSGEATPAFTQVLIWTGLATVLLFPGLVIDGVVKGFENFFWLRVAEVGSTVGYALCALWFVTAAMPFETVAYALLVSLLLRSTGLAWVAWRHARAAGLRLQRPAGADWREAAHYGSHLGFGKLLTTARDQALSPVIGATVGPAAVGVFDVLVRIPRFLKSVLALLNSALLPLTARLNHAADQTNLARVVYVGLALVSVTALPLCATGALFAGELLRFWIGPQLAALGPWHAALFVVPVLNAWVGIASTALLPRPNAVKLMNRLILLQTLLLFAVAAALHAPLGELAFVAGIALSNLAVFPLQMHQITRELALDWRYLNTAARISAGVLALFAIAWALRLHAWVSDLPTLVVGLGVSATTGVLLAMVLLPADLRSPVARYLKQRLRP